MTQSSIEKQLKKLCTENDAYNELYSTWNLNKESISQVLSNIVKDYPHYSRHDISHSENVLSNIERLLGDKGIEALSPTDMWLILHATYFHDSGMVINHKQLTELWGKADFKDFLDSCANSSDIDVKKAAKLLSEFNPQKEDNYSWALEVRRAVTLINAAYYRSHHGELSETYIKNTNIWGIEYGHNELIQARLVNLVGTICALHMCEFDAIMKLHKISNGFKNDYVHPRFIACLLRLGDVLDLDNGRFNPFVEQIYGALPETSSTHREKHNATTHILITPNKIEVEADCPTDEVYRETAKWFESLKNEVEKLQQNWNDIAPDTFERAPKLAEPTVMLNGQTDKLGFAALKMEISQTKALELVQGSSFYQDPFVCLREIIQNAEDASKIQLWRDIIDGKYYYDGDMRENGIDEKKVTSQSLMPYDIPQWIYDIYAIRVIVENDNNDAVVKIIDKGIGITPEKLKRMCNIGLSYHGQAAERQELASMPKWLQPTGSFGIGLQSCFLLTDHFTMETKAEGEDGMEICFVPPHKSSYTVVKPKENLKRGTTVTLKISNDTHFSFQLFNYTHKQLSQVDPFRSKAIVIYKVIESIVSDCPNSLFKINLKSETLGLDEPVNSMETGLCRPTDGKFWSFFSDYNQATCWYNSNLYHISLFDRIGSEKLQILFKGKKVDKLKRQQGFVGLNITIDLYGRKTEDTLTINRNELKTDAIPDINKDLEYVVNSYFREIYEHRTNLPPAFFSCQYILAALIHSDLTPDEIREIKTSLEEPINDSKMTFRVLKKNDGTFKKENVLFSELMDNYPFLSYINEDVIDDPSPMLHPTPIKTETLCEHLNSDSYAAYDCIIINDILKCYLTAMSKRRMQYVNYLDRNDIRLYTIVDADTSDVIFDPYTRTECIKALIYTSGLPVRNNVYTERMCIPAIEGYEDIAIEKPEGLLGYLEFASQYIISPLTQQDSNTYTIMKKKPFVETITTTPEFKNLVDYVKETSSKDLTEEQITADYTRLLEEYYDIMSKSNQAN